MKLATIVVTPYVPTGYDMKVYDLSVVFENGDIHIASIIDGSSRGTTASALRRLADKIENNDKAGRFSTS